MSISIFQNIGMIAFAGLLSCANAEHKNPAENQTPVVTTSQQSKMQKSIYDYSFRTLDGKKIKLSDYKGKKMLIVNTASECGYTPQYEQLEEVYKKYQDKLVIIGFPTNDFGEQEPGTNEEIGKFCQKNYGVTFPISEKITVKGDKTPDLYKWLTTKELNGKLDSEIKWNFQKYLIDENGNLISVYYSKVKPDAEEIINEIEN